MSAPNNCLTDRRWHLAEQAQNSIFPPRFLLAFDLGGQFFRKQLADHTAFIFMELQFRRTNIFLLWLTRPEITGRRAVFNKVPIPGAGLIATAFTTININLRYRIARRAFQASMFDRSFKPSRVTFWCQLPGAFRLPGGARTALYPGAGPLSSASLS